MNNQEIKHRVKLAVCIVNQKMFYLVKTDKTLLSRHELSFFERTSEPQIESTTLL